MALNQVPQANQRISSTQPTILENFTTFINDEYKINHVEFNPANSADKGKHTLVELIDRGAGFNPVTAANELALYVRRSTATGNLELFTRRPSSGDVIAFTAFQQNENDTGGTTPAHQSWGWTFLPSGLLVKWGNIAYLNPSITTGTTINFPTVSPSATPVPAFNGNPFFVNPWLISKNLNNKEAPMMVRYVTGSTPTSTGFVAVFGGGLDADQESIAYLAIGMKV